MAIRFDESLPALLESVRKCGITISDDALLVVREATGRLLIALRNQKVPQGAAVSITTDLRDYAAPTIVVEGSLAARLFEDPGARRNEILLDDEWVSFRFIDRRLVGADWLRDPVFELAALPPRIVFGSLKGGVGRSTAIAVLAADLARNGKRVLVIDLDLEAPGVGFLLLPSSDDLREDRRPRFGVIDYLVESSIGHVADEELIDFIGVSPLVNGLVHVLPAAGRVTDENPENMIAKLSRSMVERVTLEGKRLSVAESVKCMIDRFVAERDYDVVLVDARAGLAELSAAGLFGVGATNVFLFGTDQQQTYRGYRYMLSHLVNTWGVGSGDNKDWRTRLVFVQSKASTSRHKRQLFRENLYELCAEQLYDQESDADGFNFSPDTTGISIPHDSLYVAYHTDYDAFDPVDDRTQLDEDVYQGPFGDFLRKVQMILGFADNGDDLA